MRISKLGALLIQLIGLTVIRPESVAAVWGSKVREDSKGREAYVTLLYGDEFLSGVRVLGKSIRDTGSKKDMVVLVSDGVSDYAHQGAIGGFPSRNWRCRNPEDELLVKFLFLLPLCALLLFYYQYNPQARALCRSSLCDNVRNLFQKILSRAGVAHTGMSSSSAISSPRNFYNGALSKVPSSLGVVSIIICLLAALVALAISFAIVPRQVMPWTGLLLMYEWTFTIFSLLFGGFLQLTYLWGKTMANQGGSLSFHSDSSDYESGKGHQKQGLNFYFTTWHYWFSMAALSVAAPSIPFIFGVTAVFARLGLMVAGVLVLASFMTYASEHLAIIYCLKGLEDRDSIRTRSNCFLY